MTQSFTAAEKHRAMIRELEFRRYVYPKRVMAGKMSRREMDWEIQILEAIAADYAKQMENERLL
jgi:hypothetical protein